MQATCAYLTNKLLAILVFFFFYHQKAGTRYFKIRCFDMYFLFIYQSTIKYFKF